MLLGKLKNFAVFHRAKPDKAAITALRTFSQCSGPSQQPAVGRTGGSNNNRDRAVGSCVVSAASAAAAATTAREPPASDSACTPPIVDRPPTLSEVAAFYAQLQQMDHLDVAKALLPILMSELGEGTNALSLWAAVNALMSWQSARRDPRWLPGMPAMPNDRLDAGLLGHAYRACRFATASYGWKGAVFFSLVDPSASRGLADMAGLLRASVAGDAAAFCSQTGISREDLVYDSGAARVGVPRHFIALDPASQRVVLAIRGTMSLNDVFTDVLARRVRFADGEAHEGIAHAAHAVYASTIDVLCSELARRPGWGLLVTGHSLGAATAMLFTILLLHHRERHLADRRLPRDAVPFGGVDVRCVAFAPPPVFAPLSALPEATSACLLSMVHGDDLVSRLSLDSVRDLLRVLGKVAAALPSLPVRVFTGVDPALIDAALADEPAFMRSWTGREGTAATEAEAQAAGGAAVGGDCGHFSDGDTDSGRAGGRADGLSTMEGASGDIRSSSDAGNLQLSASGARTGEPSVQLPQAPFAADVVASDAGDGGSSVTSNASTDKLAASQPLSGETESSAHNGAPSASSTSVTESFAGSGSARSSAVSGGILSFIGLPSWLAVRSGATTTQIAVGASGAAEAAAADSPAPAVISLTRKDGSAASASAAGATPAPATAAAVGAAGGDEASTCDAAQGQQLSRESRPRLAIPGTIYLFRPPVDISAAAGLAAGATGTVTQAPGGSEGATAAGVSLESGSTGSGSASVASAGSGVDVFGTAPLPVSEADMTAMQRLAREGAALTAARASPADALPSSIQQQQPGAHKLNHARDDADPAALAVSNALVHDAVAGELGDAEGIARSRQPHQHHQHAASLASGGRGSADGASGVESSAAATGSSNSSASSSSSTISNIATGTMAGMSRVGSLAGSLVGSIAQGTVNVAAGTIRGVGTALGSAASAVSTAGSSIAGALGGGSSSGPAPPANGIAADSLPSKGEPLNSGSGDSRASTAAAPLSDASSRVTPPIASTAKAAAAAAVDDASLKPGVAAEAVRAAAVDAHPLVTVVGPDALGHIPVTQRCMRDHVPDMYLFSLRQLLEAALAQQQQQAAAASPAGSGGGRGSGGNTGSGGSGNNGSSTKQESSRTAGEGNHAGGSSASTAAGANVASAAVAAAAASCMLSSAAAADKHTLHHGEAEAGASQRCALPQPHAQLLPASVPAVASPTATGSADLLEVGTSLPPIRHVALGQGEFVAIPALSEVAGAGKTLELTLTAAEDDGCGAAAALGTGPGRELSSRDRCQSAIDAAPAATSAYTLSAAHAAGAPIASISLAGQRQAATLPGASSSLRESSSACSVASRPLPAPSAMAMAMPLRRSGILDASAGLFATAVAAASGTPPPLAVVSCDAPAGSDLADHQSDRV